MDLPEKPDQSDCCNSGCSPCIFDIYEKNVELYKKSLKNPKQLENRTIKNCLSETTYSYFQLSYKQDITTDTFLFIFEYVPKLTNNSYALFYQPGQHFLLKNDVINFNSTEKKFIEINDPVESFTRAYTPVPVNVPNFEGRTHFATIIKIYKHGKMSRFIHKLTLGSITKWRGPYGDYNINYDFKNMLCLTQGTGLSPIYSVIQNILENENCYTRITLLCCFRNFEDILLRKEVRTFLDFWNFDCTMYLPHESADIFLSSKINYNEKVVINRITQPDINTYFDQTFVDISKTEVLICGTDKFCQDMRKLIDNKDVKTVHIF